jgi:hypothetical protein
MVTPWLADAHSRPTTCAAAARVSVRGSPSTTGLGVRASLILSNLPSSGPVIAQQLGDKELICTFLEGAAHLAAAAGQPERALRLAGAAAAQREAIDSVLFPVLGSLLYKWLAPARTALGRAGTTTMLATGRALSLEQALAEASAGDYAHISA